MPLHSIRRSVPQTAQGPNLLTGFLQQVEEIKKKRAQDEQIKRILQGQSMYGEQRPTATSRPSGIAGLLGRISEPFNPLAAYRGTTPLEQLYAQKTIESRFTSPFGKAPWHQDPEYAKTETGRIAAGLEPRAGRTKEGYPESYQRDLAEAIRAINSGEYDVFDVFREMAQRYPAQSSELKRILLAEKATSDLDAWLRMQPEFAAQYEAEKTPKKKFRLPEIRPPSVIPPPTEREQQGMLTPQMRGELRRRPVTPQKVGPGLEAVAKKSVAAIPSKPKVRKKVKSKEIPFDTSVKTQSAPDMRLNSVWAGLSTKQKKAVWDNEDKVRAALDNGYTVEEVLSALGTE